VFSPDGTKVMYVRKLNGRRSIWVVNADGSQAHQVTSGFVFASAAWAPDSRRIAVAAFPASKGVTQLFIVRSSGGKRRGVPHVSNPTTALAWTPNGRWITYGGLDGTIWRIRPTGADRKQLGKISNHEIRRLLWSPDGQHLAYGALTREESD
jgi:WD40 repeat protein